MNTLPQNLTATSDAIEAEVLAKQRQLTSELSARQWLSKELHQLAHMQLETASPASQEAWLKRVFANLRLHYLAQLGGAVASPKALHFRQEAEVEVIDILAEETGWARLCALGHGTYEQLIYRLRAMAIMGITLATSSDEYVTRFCTEYRKFGDPAAEAEAERNWLPLLLSIRTALKTSPIVEKAVKKLNLKVGDQVIAVPKHIAHRPASPISRERVVSFSAVLGLLVVCGAVLWGGPTWKQGGQSKEPAVIVSPVGQAVPSTPPPVQPTPSSKPISKDDPSPVVTAPEQVGFYLIGVAAREEASAQAEAQQRRQQGLQPRVVYSSDWSGLTPNYYLVVYGVFANRADTEALRKDLAKRGIKTYIMHSGKRLRP